VAINPGNTMALTRPLLWTLDGLDGYLPKLIVRQPEQGPLSESSPLGRLDVRVVDVLNYQRKFSDSLFLLPETSILSSMDFEAEDGLTRGPGWLPGLHLEVLEEGWRLRMHGETQLAAGPASRDQILGEISSYGKQIHSEGLILGLHDRADTSELMAWLESLQSWTKTVLLDARPPEEWAPVD
jgi:hypothetical protein